MKGKWMKRALSIMLISVFAVTLCVGIGLKTVKAEETADTLMERKNRTRSGQKIGCASHVLFPILRGYKR